MTISDQKMLVITIDNKGLERECPIYYLGELFSGIVSAVRNHQENEAYGKYFKEYDGKYTRFNTAIDFCLREMGWKIVNPLLDGSNSVLLFTNNELMLISNDEYYANYLLGKEVNPIMSFPKLDDESIGYVPLSMEESIKDSGIKDSKGFIANEKMGSMEDTASLMLILEMMRDEGLAKEYVNSEYFSKNDMLGFYKNVFGCQLVEKKYEEEEFELPKVKEVVEEKKEAELLIKPITK